MKIVLTGGHLSPALAVIPALQKKYDLVFLGRRHAFDGDTTDSLEYSVIHKLHIPFFNISTGRFSRKVTLSSFLSLFKIPIGMVQSFLILKKEKPSLVLTFGGYIGLTVAIPAYFLGIPIVTHEQTITIGLANSVIENLAKRVCLSFPLKNNKDKKRIFTGNPLRPALFEEVKENPFFHFPNDKLPIIYITGGSTGSHFINVLIGNTLAVLTKHAIVVHQTGNSHNSRDIAMLQAQKAKLPQNLQDRYVLTEFISEKELSWLYKNITLLIGRSGANTTTEILAFGIPSILIPLPMSAAKEQQKQAKLIETVGLGKAMLQDAFSEKQFVDTVLDVLENSKSYKQHATAARSYIKEDAAAHIVSVIGDLLNEKKKQT